MGRCRRYDISRFLDFRHRLNINAEAVAKEDSARASYTGTARAPPSRRDRAEEDATSDRDESHRYGGESIVADDEDD